VHVRVHANHTRTFAASASSWPTRARRIAFSCSTEEGSEDEEEGGEVAEEGSEDAECDEEGELLAPPPLTTAVGTCGRVDGEAELGLAAVK